MPNKKCLRLISTDGVGFFGTAKQFVYLYKDHFEDGTFDGVEAVAVAPVSRTKKFVSTLKKANIPVVSFHGPTGGENQLPLPYRIMMNVVNRLLIDAENLFKNFKGKEILFHAPYTERQPVKQAILRYRPKKLWIENHLAGKKGVEKALEQVLFYRKKGVNASGLLDVYHYVVGMEKSVYLKNWGKLVDEMTGMVKDGFSGIHFPIGSRAADSLPIDEMTDKMLMTFAKKIIPKVEKIVIENQQKNLGMIYSTESMLKKQKQRDKINILRLKKAGIL